MTWLAASGRPYMQDIKEAEGEESAESVADLEQRLDELKHLQRKQDVTEAGG